MPVISFKNQSHWKNLNHLISILEILQPLNKGDRVSIDSNGFATPFQVVPSACVINNKNLSYGLTKGGTKMSRYLEIVHFPKGVSAINAKPGASGNYIPIARVTGRPVLLFSGKNLIRILRINIVN